MAYAWNALGMANLIASALLLALAVLFLRARRSEFTVTFSLYCVATAAQKFSGGMWLYLAADEATRAGWRLAVSGLYLVVIPLLTHALAAFVWEKRFTKQGLARFALYLPSAALAPLAIIDRSRFESLSLAFALTFTALLLPCLVLVYAKHRRASPGMERTQSRYMLVYLVIVIAFTAEARALTLLMGRVPWWELAIAYVAATTILLYGILKTHLFDIDVRIKWTLQRGTVAAVFVGVFIVVTQVAQGFFQTTYGWAFGGVAAGLLLIALRPIQLLSERLANAAMPSVRPLQDMAHPERTALYREQATIAWADGVLTTGERRMLDAARARLGLTAEEVVQIEAESIAARTT